MYLGVSVTVIGVGLLSDAISLFTAVAAAGVAVACVAAATTVAHVPARG